MTHYDVLIVGTGHGGAQAAIALRQRGFAGTIGMAGEETVLPYERPPLTKEYLAGAKPFERILIRPPSFWLERGIDMRLGRRIVAIRATDHLALDADGNGIRYGSLVWAAGGHARRLSCDGAGLRGVHCIRTRADADRLIAELEDIQRVVIVGGGYIGLEAAATLTSLGKQVTVLEAQDRVLARVAGPSLSRFYEAEHRRRGVEIRCGVQVDSIEANEGRASGVRMRHGAALPADAVIVGIGIVPAVQPLLDAGAAGSNGVAVDEQCRTTLPDVYAIGDCAAHRNPYASNVQVRLESVQNATDMAAVAAGTIMGETRAYVALPWFWSHQYDLKLQTVGVSLGYDQEIVRGDPSSRSFSIVYLKNKAVIALDCVNSVRDYVQGRAMVMSGQSVPGDRIADHGVELKSLHC